MDIWKGKNPSVDEETVNNAAYFSNEICNVHRSKLPTPQEFTNVCKWIIDNTNWSISDAEGFLKKIMETYLQTRHIYNINDIVKIGPGQFKDIKTGKGFDSFSEKGNITLAVIVFFMNKHFKSNKSEGAIDMYKKHCKDMFEPAFKKFNVSWENWPDYSEGFEMLVKRFN